MRQALYRKYRPQNFSEVFGQDNIVNILKNQIKNDKISHAYIFSGTRGTGKTSTAKIFAKAVNCLNPEDGNPCNKCENCKSIIEEQNMDIIEMDAASNRGIDDIRQLRDQVIYPPASLKYKVYIIDEAHMITREAFNALLKIMEEPPKHLIFILATTELEKIPDTILSRTQRFEFKSLSEEDIKKQIKYILEKEKIEIEERAIEIIANVASGAMRDALSILDQVISIGKKEISTSEVTDLLGIFSDEVKINYIKSVFNKDVKSLLSIIDSELNKGKDPHNFIKDIITFLKDLIYIKAGVKENIFGNISQNISLDQLINTVDLLLEYEDLMKKSDSAGLLFRISSIKIIDYMPRKQLEAKINNLEERILYLEKNGVNIESNHSENNTFVGLSKNIEEKKDVNLEDVDKLIEEFDSMENTKIENDEYSVEDAISKELNNTEEKINNSEKIDTHLSRLRTILSQHYPATNMLFEGLVKTQKNLNTYTFFLDEEHITMSLGMNFFIKKALDELEKEVNILYNVKFEVFNHEKNDLVNDNLEDVNKINKLKEFFPNGINIIEKK